MSEARVPAGWYPDPEHAGELRYWDGAAWTEHRTTAPGPAPSAARPRFDRKVVLALVAAAVVLCSWLGLSSAFNSGDGQGPAPANDAKTPSEPSATTEPAAAPEEPAIPLAAATVVRVVDGDTAVFQLEDGNEEKVRFIGVDTPESTNSIEIYGKEASAYTSEALPVGADVYLEQDVESRDKYGRLLAYVWLDRPTNDDESEVREKMLNAKLALDGYAQQLTIQPNSKYAEYFTTFVAEARTAERGLWNPDLNKAPPAAKKPAAKPKAPKATYIGNRNTKKFHYPSCSSVGQMNESNKVILSSREAAVSGGYVPCKRCNP